MVRPSRRPVRLPWRMGAELVMVLTGVIVGSWFGADTRIAAAANLSEQGTSLGQEPSPSIVITRIEIRGLRKIAPTTVRGSISLSEGDRFSVDAVRQLVRDVYRLGYFEDVQVATEGFEGGLSLIVTVTEWPVLREIRYEGYDQLPLDKLKEQVTIAPGNFLDLRVLTQAKQRLTSYYHDQGYFQATVLPVLQARDAGAMGVTFVITEGKRARVRMIEFFGNDAFSGRQLRKVIETKPYFWLISWLTDSGLYQETVVAQDVERLRDHYLDEGYLQVQVGDPRVTLTDDQRWFELAYPLVEGDQYTIATVELSGVTLFDEVDVRAVLSATPASLFRRREIREDISSIVNLYGEDGYAYASVVPELSPDETTRRVSVRYQVEEGEQFSVRRIQIAGNTKTRDNVIRRELRLSEQDIFDTTALRRSYQRLNNLNFFESIEIVPTRVASDEVDLDVSVKEKPTGTFSVGGGYSSVNRFVGLVEITQGNLFGRGQLLRLNAQLGGRLSTYSLTFRDPYVFDYPVSSTVSLFNQKRNFDAYSEQRRGGSLTLGKSFTEYVSGSAGYSFQKLDLFDLDESAPKIIEDQEGESTTSAVRLTVVRDSRDVFIAPTEGSRHSAVVQYAGTFLGGNNDFYKVELDSVVYFPAWGETVFSVRGRLGYAHQTVVDGTLPAGERFYVGGIHTVRGFDFGEAGPKADGEIIGGNKQLIMNLEYLFPIVPAANIRGVIFFDAGRAFDFGDSIRLSELRTSVGAGIRLFLPIGPIRIEWGYVINPKLGEKRRPVEFTIGAQF